MTAWTGRLRYGRALLTRAAAVGVVRLDMALRGLPDRQPLESWNRLFDRRLATRLRREWRQLNGFDIALWSVVNDSRLYGQIVFEYGTLLNAIDDWRDLRVLDLGTGRSTLPHWMSAQGAAVVSFELPAPFEVKPGGWYGRVASSAHGGLAVAEVRGSMQALPLVGNAFDVVTSFSVVEHLDTDPTTRTWVPYAEQCRRLREVLREMVRVTKRGGLIYVTSECCDYGRATRDEWRGAAYCGDAPEVSAAWPVRDVPKLFYDYIQTLGCTLKGPVLFDPDLVGRDERYQTFRGPFFSGFSLLAVKQ